ncbi:hypothetical protein PRUPE_3G071200 [Prunus persica]|uniref:LOB domain-containing protein n=1 Tax=Prunus persica TaxID=3760 RepID=A0A251PWN4_PRUPE|nr:hypothetical protein PRUPE_3G071200 [Prunus persica]
MENRDQGAAQNHACASCNHQRRKCDETCEMAPYFPASRYNEFQNAHKIFCVSNIQKIMAMAAPDQRQAAAESLPTEGNARKNDPDLLLIDTISCNEAIKLIGSNIKLYKLPLVSLRQLQAPMLMPLRQSDRRCKPS